MRISSYEDFIAATDELGFLPFSNAFMPGGHSLDSLTQGAMWHNDKVPGMDPWEWKDRVAAEKRLAFGCVLGGHKGFISRRMYPVFYAACLPSEVIEERYGMGLVSQLEMDIYRLLEGGDVLGAFELKTPLGISKKNGESRFDTALRSLQNHFEVTIAGNKRKRSLAGPEYGWPANAYQSVEVWAGDWLDGADDWDTEGAREAIVEEALGRVCPGADRAELVKRLFRG